MKAGDFVREANGSWYVYRVLEAYERMFTGVLCNRARKAIHRVQGEVMLAFCDRYEVEPDPLAFAAAHGFEVDLNTAPLTERPTAYR